MRGGAIIALLLGSVMSQAAAPAGRLDAETELVALGKKLTYFEIRNFTDGDPGYYPERPEHVPAGEWDSHDRAMAPLFARAYPRAALLPLLRHRDPRVRTLALAGLFAHEDPRDLPHIAGLLSDEAASFPEPEAHIGLGFGRRFGSPLLKPRRVADTALSFVWAYLHASGISIGARGTMATFDAFWEDRKGHRHWAGLYVFRFGRRRAAARSEDELLAGGRALRREIGRLPALERALTLLWLRASPAHSAGDGDPGILRACVGVGPDALLDFLRGKKQSDDPDLAHAGPRHRGEMVNFLLTNAPRLFRGKDADVLRDVGRGTGAGPTSSQRHGSLPRGLVSSWKRGGRWHRKTPWRPASGCKSCSGAGD